MTSTTPAGRSRVRYASRRWLTRPSTSSGRIDTATNIYFDGGGAVRVVNGATLHLHACMLLDNSGGGGGVGGAISANNATLHVNNSTLSGNRGRYGGAISAVPAEDKNFSYRQLLSGVMELPRHWWLVIRTSIIGAVIGMIPGLGGSAAAWLCYGHAVQSSKTPERFGKGAIEGVIAPETASNGKEGGSLLPTLFFGIPGSSGMAVLLGAFLILGIQPGEFMMTDHLDLVWTLIWALIVGNLIAVAILLVVCRWVALLTFVNGKMLVPFILVFVAIGCFVSEFQWQNLVTLVLFSAIGYAFLRANWPRAPFVIGLVLGGTNALSRSLYSQLVPPGKEAEYFSIYEVGEKATSTLGPLLFAVVGRMVYDRPHTRELIALQAMGLSQTMPFAAVTFVIAGAASMGLPGFSGFVAELQVLIGAWHAFPMIAVVVGVGILVGVAYTLRVLQQVVGGLDFSWLETTLRKDRPISRSISASRPARTPRRKG